MANPDLLLGVDGGDTGTTAMLTEAGGRILGRGRSGPSDLRLVGPDAAFAEIERAIAAAFADAGRSPGPALVACLGVGGSGLPGERAVIEGWAARARPADRVVLVDRGELVVAAGTPEGRGVGLIAGTGVTALARALDGRTARAGGWGPPPADEGGGYDVALAGLRLVARRADGREALRVLRAKGTAPDPAGRDPLAEHLGRAVGVAPVPGVFAALRAGGWDRPRIASLAAAVVAAAADDPDVTPWILEPAGFELGQAALAAARALDWSEPTLPLAMAGDFLLSAPPVADALLGYLKRFAGREVVAGRVDEPVRGAIVLARGGLGPDHPTSVAEAN